MENQRRIIAWDFDRLSVRTFSLSDLQPNKYTVSSSNDSNRFISIREGYAFSFPFFPRARHISPIKCSNLYFSKSSKSTRKILTGSLGPGVARSQHQQNHHDLQQFHPHFCTEKEKKKEKKIDARNLIQ